jgi:hypothetical protein
LSRGELSAPEFLATVVHPVQAKAGANPFPLDTLAGDTMHMLGDAIRQRGRRRTLLIPMNTTINPWN